MEYISLYECLGLMKNATKKDIENAHYEYAKNIYSDTIVSGKEAEFIKISLAYRIFLGPNIEKNL